MDKAYWDQFYLKGKLPPWDMGSVSPPLKTYFDQLDNLSLRILIPGAGNAWEVEYLNQLGFEHVYLLDFSSNAIASFRDRNPKFPENRILCEDFFQHQGHYDLICEQTFFTSLPRDKREAYARQLNRLLKKDGKVMGLLFNHDFEGEEPPFGAEEEEYLQLFLPWFEMKVFEIANNSIPPRKGRELFFVMQKKL